MAQDGGPPQQCFDNSKRKRKASEIEDSVSATATFDQEVGPSNSTFVTSTSPRPVKREWVAQSKFCPRHALFNCHYCPRQKPRYGNKYQRVGSQHSIMQHASQAALKDQHVGLHSPREHSSLVFPIENDDGLHHAVDYLKSCLAPLMFPDMPTDTNPLVSIALPFALRHADTFHALVAYSRAHYDTLTLNNTLPSYYSLYHRGKAVQLLQERMKHSDKCADDAAILANVFLLGAAARFEESKSCEWFYQGIIRMVEVRGGLDNLGLEGYLKHIVLTLEALDACASTAPSDQTSSNPTETTDSDSSSPPLPRQSFTYEQHPFPPDLCGTISHLSPGFEDLAVARHLSSEIITAIEPIFQYANKSKTTRLIHGPGDHMLWLKDLVKQLPQSRRVEHLACLSVMMLCLAVFSPSIHINTVSRAQRRRIERFCFPDDVVTTNTERLETELQIWTLFLATHAAMDGDQATHTSEIFFEKVMQKAQQRWRRATAPLGWDNGLKPILVKFFMNDRMASEWEACWVTHSQRRRTNHVLGFADWDDRSRDIVGENDQRGRDEVQYVDEERNRGYLRTGMVASQAGEGHGLSVDRSVPDLRPG